MVAFRKLFPVLAIVALLLGTAIIASAEMVTCASDNSPGIAAAFPSTTPGLIVAANPATFQITAAGTPSTMESVLLNNNVAGTGTDASAAQTIAGGRFAGAKPAFSAERYISSGRVQVRTNASGAAATFPLRV